MRWLKVFLARFTQRRMRPKANRITEAEAKKWNFLQAIILSNGMVKWDWNKFLGINVVSCSKCCKTLFKGTIEDREFRKKVLCNGCRKKEEEKDLQEKKV